MDDTESLKAALNGAYAAFVVTNYWETMNADVERKQGKNVADVAKVMILQPTQYSVIRMAHIYEGNWHPTPRFQQSTEYHKEYVLIQPSLNELF
jgi:hypothetical protein